MAIAMQGGQDAADARLQPGPAAEPTRQIRRGGGAAGFQRGLDRERLFVAMGWETRPTLCGRLAGNKGEGAGLGRRRAGRLDPAPS